MNLDYIWLRQRAFAATTGVHLRRKILLSRKICAYPSRRIGRHKLSNLQIMDVMQVVSVEWAFVVRASVHSPRTLVTVKALCLSAFAPSRARDAPGFIFERMLHGSIYGLVIVVTFVREAASRGQMVGVAELLICDAILETVDLGFGGWADGAVDSLTSTVDWYA